MLSRWPRTSPTSSSGRPLFRAPLEAHTKGANSRWTSEYPTITRTLITLAITETRFSQPQLHFKTKVYHCNISHTGAICELILLDAS